MENAPVSSNRFELLHRLGTVVTLWPAITAVGSVVIAVLTGVWAAIQGLAPPVILTLAVVMLASMLGTAFFLLRVFDWWERRRIKQAGQQISAPTPDIAKLRKPSGEFHKFGQVALRKRAEELARGLLGFVEAQRNRQPDLGDLLRPQIGSPTGQMERFDPFSYAITEYRVQYKDKVSAIYSELFGGSLLRRPLSSGFRGTLEKMTGSPDDPTTFNEIVAIALELELKASRLPSE